MNLAEHQRKLLGMIRGTYTPSMADEPYLQAVDNSQHLGLVREIVTWWRLFGIERYCVLTARLLKQRGNFETIVSHFIIECAFSPFINELGEAFLSYLVESGDSLLSEVAEFELALTRVKRGDPAAYVMEWGHDPVTVLTCLVKGLVFEADNIRGSYRVTVSASLEGMFSIERI
jgi:hypothetical protein